MQLITSSLIQRAGGVRSAGELPGRPRELTARSADGPTVTVGSRWLQVNGVRMHARVALPAPDGLAVVLVHGLGVSSRYMVPLMVELAPRFRTFAPDLPGFGHTDAPPGDLGIGDLADWLLAWAEAAGSTPVALVANSVGCQIAVEAAIRRPEMVARMVLQGPTLDPSARAWEQGGRLLRTGIHEPPELNLVIARDYLACGARRPASVLRDALRQPLLERLPEVEAPTLVVRGEHDRVVPQEWAERVTEALADGELAVIPGAAHTLNFSAPRQLALLTTGFLDPRRRPRLSSTRDTRPPEDSLADFDSASAMLRAAAAACRGEDLEGFGMMPARLMRLAAPAAPALRLLPTPAREFIYSRSSGAEGVSPAAAHTVSGEAVAQWMVGRYPVRQYPTAVIGSSSGALVHLCAALGVPFLPQTFMVPIKQPEVDPDDPRHGLEAGVPPGRLLLEANPELRLHHMHDPNQDRLTLRQLAYFRVKRARLGDAYTRFLEQALPAGATLLVSDCRLRWPVTHVRERYVFQFGALGGMPAAEFHNGSRRVAEYLRREDVGRTRWDPPAPDGDAPEAEWGFEPELLHDLQELAKRRGWKLRTLSFDDPEDLSPLVADLYRWWYAAQGLRTDRLLVESFVLLDPYWTLRTGSVPLWLKFPVDASAERAEEYLESRDPFDEIRLTLFSHGTEGVGVAPIERWRKLISRAQRHGELLATSETAYPRDLATIARFHHALRQIPQRQQLPGRLTLGDIDAFLANAGSYRGVSWSR